jgi:hypothetical protein
MKQHTPDTKSADFSVFSDLMLLVARKKSLAATQTGADDADNSHIFTNWTPKGLDCIGPVGRRQTTLGPLMTLILNICAGAAER